MNTSRQVKGNEQFRGDRGSMKLAIVGAFGGTHIGGSLARAAVRLDVETVCFDVAGAAWGNRFLGALIWRFGDRRPYRLDRFSSQVVDACTQARVNVLVATGAAPLTKSALHTLQARGVVTVNYSTDDPWNKAQRARWHLGALSAYDLVFTPRRANVEDLKLLGCSDVRHLPFAYDDALFASHRQTDGVPVHDVLFVGGADSDRVQFMKRFMHSGPPVALVGGYWDRYPAMRHHALGHKTPEDLCRLTVAAKVNLCLVRRANRDGHVMRSFEIAAIGGCMLTEDTEEHRALFGSDGEAVVYFRTPAEAARRACALLADAAERARLSASVHARIAGGAHSYTDRLASMLDAARGVAARKRTS
jgi:spore maturation protein CgeB